MSVAHDAPSVNGRPHGQVTTRPLLAHHRTELRSSGLTDATVQAAGIYSITSVDELARVLNWQTASTRRVPALCFPFVGETGPVGYARVKLDNPRRQRDGIVKYESPRGRGNEIYLPPQTIGALRDSSVPLVITEGEKKALAADQAGYRCLGLVGTYGWKVSGQEMLLPLLAGMPWSGRRVYICFDSDRATNPAVRDAEARLALQLQRHGATVRVVELPPAHHADGTPTKVGLDDYLVAHGAANFQRLLEQAGPPTPPDPALMRTIARRADPGEEARNFLALRQVDGVSALVSWRGTWWCWQDGRYVPASAVDVQAQVIRHLSQHLSMLGTREIGNVMAHLRAHATIPSEVDQPSWLGEPPRPWAMADIICCRERIIHLPSMVEGSQEYGIPASPRLFSPAALDIDLDLAAAEPIAWRHFLAELWPDDQCSQATLQEMFGYFLTPDNSQQKIFLIVGPPRSGKGTILKVLTALVGQANVVAPTLSSLTTNFGLWPLIGKTAAVITDARLRDVAAGRGVLVERLLAISGDDSITIDRKHQEPITTRLLTRFLLLTNEIPELQDASGALASRLVILRLTRSWLGCEDTRLTARLLAELPGILLWAIRGWECLHERGHFSEPPSAAELREQLVRLTSPIHGFLADRCFRGPDQSVDRRSLYAAYREWCTHNGVHPVPVARFGRDLHAAVPDLCRSQPRTGASRDNLYTGVALVDHASGGTSAGTGQA